MGSNAEKGAGVAVQMENTIGADSFFTVANLIEAPQLGLGRGTFEKTNHQSEDFWEEFGKAFKNGGELALKVQHVLDEATHGMTSGMLRDFNEDEDIFKWRMLFPNGAWVKFPGILTKWNIANPLKDARTADISIKVAGKPEFYGF